MKRTLCLILASLMAFTCISCSETASEDPAAAPDDSSAVSAEEAAAAEEEPEGIPEPELPAKNYEGASFTTLTRGRYSGSFEEDYLIAEDLNGEPVNDAIYNRNIAVEEKFNLKTEFIENPDAAGEAQRLVMSSDNSVDVVDTQATSLSSLSTGGCLINLLSLNHMNLAADYWSENVMNDLQISDRLYLMTSDMSMARLENTFFLYFNKVLLKDYNLEDIYTLVEEGKWTLSKYVEYITAVSSDLNGDGVFDRNDLFGSLYENADILYYIVSCGIKLTERDDAKGLICTAYSEKTIDVVEKVKECFDSVSTISYMDVANGADTSGYENLWEWARTLFAQRQYLILPCGMFELAELRDMEDDFGIAPMPKYDEAQEDYAHRINAQGPAFAVPVSCGDTERAGIVMEYASWTSNQLLLPAYYEITVKQKTIRDDKAVEMVDLIRRTARYEISEVYNLGISSVLNDAVANGDFASKYTKQEKVINKTIERLFQSIQELN